MIANNNLVNPFQYSRAPLLFPFLFPSASAFQPRDLLPLKKEHTAALIEKPMNFDAKNAQFAALCSASKEGCCVSRE